MYLEYIQRNLPEGVAMEVTKVRHYRVLLLDWFNLPCGPHINLLITLFLFCLCCQTAMEKVPDHILEPMWKEHPIDDKPSQWKLWWVADAYWMLFDRPEWNETKSSYNGKTSLSPTTITSLCNSTSLYWKLCLCIFCCRQYRVSCTLFHINKFCF